MTLFPLIKYLETNYFSGEIVIKAVDFHDYSLVISKWCVVKRPRV